jgi:hypothetical protein
MTDDAASSEALAEILGLTDVEFEIYRDYQAHGAIDGDRLVRIAKHEASRRRLGAQPITGAMIAKMGQSS